MATPFFSFGLGGGGAVVSAGSASHGKPGNSASAVCSAEAPSASGFEPPRKSEPAPTRAAAIAAQIPTRRPISTPCKRMGRV